MSSKRQMQMCKATTTTTFLLEAWRYISQFLRPITFQKIQTKTHQYSDLSLVSKSSIHDYFLIRIMDRTSMAVARDLFGRTFGIGSRNIPPRKGFPKKVLEVGITINIIDTSSPNRYNKFKEFICDQRIDLVFEEFSRRLIIRVVYSDVKAETPIVADVLKFPRVLQPPVEPIDNNPPQRIRKVKAVPCNTTFIYNDKMYTVTQSDGRRAFALCDDGGVLCFSNDELWTLILDNL